MRNGKIIGTILLAISIIFITYSVYVSSIRNLSSLEEILFQVIIFIISVSGSSIVSSTISKKNTTSITHAKSAVRRLVVIYFAADLARSKLNNQQAADSLLETQMLQVRDAVRDWQDLNPEELGDLEKITKQMNREI